MQRMKKARRNFQYKYIYINKVFLTGLGESETWLQVGAITKSKNQACHDAFLYRTWVFTGILSEDPD